MCRQRVEYNPARSVLHPCTAAPGRPCVSQEEGRISDCLGLNGGSSKHCFDTKI